MTRPIDPTSLRLFIAVCEEGTIARAGEREFIAASAVSKRIADIEERAGTALLSRGQRGVAPTPAGEVLLRHSRRILREFERLHAELAEHASGEGGYVRLLANVSSMVEFLPEALSGFMLAQPKIRVDLEERGSLDVVRGVADGSADIGICRDVVPTAGLDVRAFRHDHFALIVAAAHPLAGQDALGFADTLDCDHVGLSSNASMYPLLQRIAAERGREWRVRMHVSTFDAAFRLMQGGRVVAVLPREAVGRSAAAYGLRAVPLTDAWARRAFVICVRGVAALSPAARRLYGHLLGERGADDAGS